MKKIYKSVISKYDIIMSEFNAAQNVENFNATSEKFSDFKSSELIKSMTLYARLIKCQKISKTWFNKKKRKLLRLNPMRCRVLTNRLFQNAHKIAPLQTPL